MISSDDDDDDLGTIKKWSITIKWNRVRLSLTSLNLVLSGSPHT